MFLSYLLNTKKAKLVLPYALCKAKWVANRHAKDAASGFQVGMHISCEQVFQNVLFLLGISYSDVGISSK